MLRITTRITGGTGGEQWNTIHSGGDTAGEATAFRTALTTFWGNMAPDIHSTYVMHVPSVCEQVDPATGQTIGEFPIVPLDVNMTASGDPNPWFTQGLIRFRTATFANGRRIQGRIFVPGTMEVQNTVGVPIAAYVNNLTTKANTFATAMAPAGDLVVYSPTHRVVANVTTVSGSNQWAVLRSRRD